MKPVLWAESGNRVLRPRDARERYRNPPREFARMVRNGELKLVTHGYYVAIPEDQRASPTWRPDIEGVALGIAAADYGRDAVALMGVSAARVLGAIPRALATGVVAVPRQRPALQTAFGLVTFVKRSLATLDTQRVNTGVTPGWTTTAEQTVLDLATRPTLGNVTPATAEEAIRSLLARCDLDQVAELAAAQRKQSAWRQLAHLAGLEGEAT